MLVFRKQNTIATKHTHTFTIKHSTVALSTTQCIQSYIGQWTVVFFVASLVDIKSVDFKFLIRFYLFVCMVIDVWTFKRYGQIGCITCNVCALFHISHSNFMNTYKHTHTHKSKGISHDYELMIELMRFAEHIL